MQPEGAERQRRHIDRRGESLICPAPIRRLLGKDESNSGVNHSRILMANGPESCERIGRVEYRTGVGCEIPKSPISILMLKERLDEGSSVLSSTGTDNDLACQIFGVRGRFCQQKVTCSRKRRMLRATGYLEGLYSLTGGLDWSGKRIWGCIAPLGLCLMCEPLQPSLGCAPGRRKQTNNKEY